MHPTWVPVLEQERETLTVIGEFLREESAAGQAWFPSGANILRAFTQPLPDVRVLIVGQDPYPTPGHAVGLSFSVAPTSGTGWLLRAFTVVVIGGLGSLPGTLYGGFIVGLVETAGAVWIGPQYRDVIVFGVLVVILLVRPNGLFSKVARA